jgi:hypothetical protein
MCPCDVLLIHQDILCEKVFALSRPVVILERIDGAQLGQSKAWIDRAAMIVKGYTFRDPAVHNVTRGRYHTLLLQACGMTGAVPGMTGKPAPLTQEQLAKIRPGYGFGAYEKMRPHVEHNLDLDAPRPIHVHFAGWVDYAKSEIETHRREALRIARRYTDGATVAGEGRVLPADQYARTLRQARVVLSPWGWGEACQRDYEAWLCGAVVVKPNSDHVLGWPDVFRSGETYVACKPDWSDANEKIDHIVNHWTDYRPMREHARALALQAFNRAAIVERMTALFHEVLG